MITVTMDGGRRVCRWRLLRWIPYFLRMSREKRQQRRLAWFFDLRPSYEKPEVMAKLRESARWLNGLDA